MRSSYVLYASVDIAEVNSKEREEKRERKKSNEKKGQKMEDTRPSVQNGPQDVDVGNNRKGQTAASVRRCAMGWMEWER